MASLQTRISDLITAIGTDYKQIRTWIGDLTGLTTTDKTNLVGAINEVKAAIAGGGAAATETVAGIAEVATQTEVNTGTDDARMVTPLKFQTRMAAFAQPLDADLTAIAAVASQTAYGRAFLALVNQAGLLALLPAPTEIASGVIELATQVEVTTGTDDVRAVTPLKHRVDLVAWAQPKSAALTTLAGFAPNNGALGSSTTDLPTSQAVKTYADGLLDANNAYQYKGVIDCAASPNYPAASSGWTYKVSVAGKIGGASGINVEVGDTLTCLVDASAAGNQATVGANWIIVQTNIDGAVVGPVSSTAGNIVTFSGVTGKIIQDSAVAVSIDGTMVANSDAKLATEKAIRTYIAATNYTKTELGNPDTDLAALYATAKV